MNKLDHSVCVELCFAADAHLHAPELLINRSDERAVLKAEKRSDKGWLIPAGTARVGLAAKTESGRSLVTLFAAADFADGAYTLSENKADKSLHLARADGRPGPQPLPLF